MISERSLNIVKATAPAVAANAEAITRRFYTILFESNPEVRPYFNAANQVSGRQQQALAGAICAYAANIDNLSVLSSAVEVIAQKHCSLGIQPEHYPIVGTHLLAAVKEILGDAVTDEVLAAWGEAYQQLAEICINRESAIYHQHATAPGSWTDYRKFVVTEKKPESEIITSFTLRPADGQPIAVFQAGQYLTVKIPGMPSSTAPRNYSLSDRPGLDYYRISVKRETSLLPNAPHGQVSNHLHDQIHVGDTLEVRAPCGEFVLAPDRQQDRPLVFLAAGIGTTPLLSMLKSLAHQGTPTPAFFVQAARNSSHHALGDEIRELSRRHRQITSHIRYDAPHEHDLAEENCDSVGRIDLNFLQTHLPTLDADFYFCGPRGFMLNLVRDLRSLGVASERLHFEFFGPRQDLSEVN